MEARRLNTFKKISFDKMPMGNHKSWWEVFYMGEWVQVWYFKYSRMEINYYIMKDEKEINITINPNTNKAMKEI